MKNFNKLLTIGMVGAMLTTSCKKEGENIFNMFTDVEVTFHDSSPYSVTDYKVVNDGDSIHIDFTMKSAKEDMYVACLLEAGTSSPIKVPIDDEHRREFSYTFKLKANRVGKMSYRVYPLDSRGIYLGDDYKKITIDVKPNFSYYTERHLFLPPDGDKSKKSYLSLTTGETFSYNEGADNSSKIDLGFYVDSVAVDPEEPDVLTPVYRIYSLDAGVDLPTGHDISSWTLRKTLFSAPQQGMDSDFMEDFVAGSVIEEEAGNVEIDQSGPVDIRGGDLVFFTTEDGRTGAIYVSTITESHNLGTYGNLYIKIVD